MGATKRLAEIIVTSVAAPAEPTVAVFEPKKGPDGEKKEAALPEKAAAPKAGESTTPTTTATAASDAKEPAPIGRRWDKQLAGRGNGSRMMCWDMGSSQVLRWDRVLAAAGYPKRRPDDQGPRAPIGITATPSGREYA